MRPGGLSVGGSERVRNGTRLSKRANRELPSNEVGWLKRLGRYCWQFKREVLLALIGGLLYTAATLVIPLLQRDIIDNVIVARTASVWPLAIGLVIAAAANFAGIFLRRYRGGKLALDVQHAMRTDLFNSLTRLDGARQDEIHTGQLVGRSISDVNMVQQLMQWGPLILGSAMVFIFSLVIMVVLSKAVWVTTLGNPAPLFPYDNPALFSMPLAFATIWIVSLMDKSRRAQRERAAFEAQYVRSETGIGAAGAHAH